MDANRARYKKEVQHPLLELAAALMPTVLQIDPEVDQRPGAVVSRINRDTRFTKDKSPYRDHAWLGFRHPGTYIGESFVIYAEFQRESYGYGMGMWTGNPEMMGRIRANILSAPDRFLELVNREAFARRFTLQGDRYKKLRYPNADQQLEAYLNMKGLSFCFSSTELSNTLGPQIYEEIRDAFLLLKPLYRLLMGLD